MIGARSSPATSWIGSSSGAGSAGGGSGATWSWACLVIRPTGYVACASAARERLVGVAGAFAVEVDLGATGRSGSRFVVIGPGVGAGEASEFLGWLACCGRGSYTQRTYALGLAHFLSWIDRHGVGLVDVDRRVVGEYVVAFRDGQRGWPRARAAAADGESPAVRVGVVLRVPRAARSRSWVRGVG